MDNKTLRQELDELHTAWIDFVLAVCNELKVYECLNGLVKFLNKIKDKLNG